MEVLAKANRQILSTRAEESIALEHEARHSFSAHTQELQNSAGVAEFVEQYRASRTDSFEQQQDPADFPEKGWKAHTILIGAWFALLPASGLLQTVGTFQAYLLTHQLKSYSAAQVSWIFSVNAFLFLFGGVQSGPTFDAHGLTMLLIPGYIGFATAVMCLSLCKEYYQFMLCWGVLGGLSSSMIWTSAIATVGHWFFRRRGIATGLATSAGSLGGVFLPIMFERLVQRLGWEWTIRTFGFIAIVFGVLAIAMMRPRMRPNPNAKRVINFQGFRNPVFALTTVAMFMIDFACLIPPAYITTYALSKGLEDSFAYQLVAILNGASVMGRALPGFIADRWGRYNVMILSSALCAILVLGMWLSASSNVGAIAGFAALFGLCSGTAYSLPPVCISQLCRTDEYASLYGTAYSLVSLATLIGIPVSGAILDRQGGSDYQGLILCCGLAYLVSAVLFTAARVFGVGWKLKKVW